MSEYALGLTVLFFFERLVPALRRLLMFPTREFLAMRCSYDDWIRPYQFLHDQYLAVSFDFAVLHLCLARNDLRRSGFDFLIFMFGSP